MLHFTLHPKLLDSKGPRVPHGAIPLREGEPTTKQPSWGYVVSTRNNTGLLSPPATKGGLHSVSAGSLQHALW